MTAERGKAKTAELFMTDPLNYFDRSYTKMHSLSPSDRSDLQLHALSARFAVQVHDIAMVGRLADRQGITSVERPEDIVPMLFEHTMYKSYPMALLERLDFARLTTWLGKLTPVDVGNVNVDRCGSIQQWLGSLAADTDLDVGSSSGTTGTMSFFPWSKQEHVAKAELARVARLQEFGKEPTQDQLTKPYHFVASNVGKYSRNYFAQAYTLGHSEMMHMRAARVQDVDLLWLAARLRAAAASGNADRVSVPDSLLSRRSELEAFGVQSAELDAVWLQEIESLSDVSTVWTIFPYDLYQIASAGLSKGDFWKSGPGSVMVVTGGSKGRALPKDWLDTVKRFTDYRVVTGYGMTEASAVFLNCSAGRYHIPPWVIPFSLNPITSELQPRHGVQRGRFAFFDLMPVSHWGGLMSGDEVEIDFDGLCDCGATSQHIAPDVVRLSEARGGDDKITCAATPEAHAQAMAFLTAY